MPSGTEQGVFVKNMKYYNKWNNNKIEIESLGTVSIKQFPNEGDVWISKIGVNIGVEQDGSIIDFTRPVLVIKKFNNHMYWILPLSSKQKSLDFYYNFVDKDQNNVSVILAQLRVSSVKRFIRKIYEIDKSDYNLIKAQLIKFLS